VVLEDQTTHVALPKLYGQPSYSRRGVVPERPRPIDPDDLPIAAFQTDDERDLAEALAGRRSVPYLTVPVEPERAPARPLDADPGAMVEPAPLAPRAAEADVTAPRRRGLGRLLGG
jgi:hypothetical protein